MAEPSKFSQMMEDRAGRHGALLEAHSQALAAHRQLVNEQVSQARLQLARQTLELQRQKALADIQKQEAVIRNQMTEQEHVTAAVTELGSLNANAPDYQVKLADVFHRYPMASKDPIVQELTKSQIASRKVVETTGAAIQQHEEAQADQLARELQVPKVYDATGRPDIAAMQKAGVELRKSNQPSNGMVKTEVQLKDGSVTETFKPDPSLSPFQRAQALAREASSHRKAIESSDREIDKLTKDHPWITETTGPTTYNGIQYFGTSKPTDKAVGEGANMEVVTPGKLATFDRYQSLLKQRAESQAKLPAIEAQRDSLLAMPVPTDTAQPPPVERPPLADIFK